MINRAWKYQTEAWIGLALIVFTLAVYWPVTHADFLNYDDPTYITDNIHVQRGLTGESVAWAFGRSHHSNWHPLTWLSLMLDAEWFGLDAGAFHRTNLLFHAANALLLFWVLRRMTGTVWRSALVAALFAWHPLHVESVAWVTERKDVLSTFFGLLTLWAYLRHVERGGKRFYALALLCFTLSLMAKSMLVTWPCVLLLLDFWPLRRMRFGAMTTGTNTVGDPPGENPFGIAPFGKLLCEKIPFFALALLTSLAAFAAQKEGGSIASVDSLPLSLRVPNALVAYATYLRKMFWPSDLAVFYPHPGVWPLAHVVLAGLLLLVLSAWVIRQWSRQPYLLVGWLWYLGTLVPVIGLVQIGKQSMADRYTYVPLMGVYVMAAWSLVELWTRWRLPKFAVAGVVGVVLAGCLGGTAAQVKLWISSETLYRHTLRVTSGNAVAHYGLGCVLARQGKSAEATIQFKAALRYSADYPDVWYNLGNLLVKEGKLADAREHFLKALQFKPEMADAHNNLGFVLAAQSKTPEAIEHYQAALRFRPEFADAHNNLAVALESLGQYEEATTHFAAAVKLNPAQADARSNLGWLLARQGKFDEAIAQYNAALQLKPVDAQTHFRLAMSLASQNKMVETVQQLREALRARPDWPTALNTLASILATHPNEQFRNGAEAVRLAERSCALTGHKNAAGLDTLAAAYAEAGQFDKALVTVQKILDLPIASLPPGLLEQLDQRVQFYLARKPYRQPQ